MIFVYRVILILILIWQIQRIHLHLIMIDKCLNFFYLNFVPQISAQIGGYETKKKLMNIMTQIGSIMLKQNVWIKL
jgi:hypothetical protein